MPQVTEFLSLGPDPRVGLAAIAKVCKEVPVSGEPFRSFRSRLRSTKLWDRDRPAAAMRVFGVSGATIVPSPFMKRMAAAATEEEIQDAVADRLFEINPLLFKTVWDLLAQRAHSKDELSKYLGSFAYRGRVPSRPDLENFFVTLQTCGVTRMIGIALVHGERGERFTDQVGAVDTDELLAEDVPYPEPEIPGAGGGEDEAAADEVVAAAPEPAPAAPAAPAVTPAGAPLPPYLRHLVDAAKGLSPLGRDKPVPVVTYASGPFSPEVLEETTKRIGGWWKEAGGGSSPYQPADFGLDPEAWMEGADEQLYRIAVAAALVFRLDADRAAVVAAYKALDQAGVLTDLYHGTVPESLPARLDARALMLASLAARRCAECPDLAMTLEQQKSAAEAFTVLDGALGRGLFRIELHWILGQLGQLGVLRWDDLGEMSALPHRLVRDTLFRLGFLDTPYAPDSAALAAAARAARKAAGADPADEIVARFAIAAGCAYDCPHRKGCDFACRERLE